MVSYSLRFFKRFLVLVPGIIIVYFSVLDIFPYFHKHLPEVLAIFVTYVLGAYILIPALTRLLRILRPPSHLPLYCVTPDGFASDPLNIAMVGSRRELIVAMQKAGWYVADATTWGNSLRQIVSTLVGRTYSNAPVSKLYLFGRRQDIAFEIPVEGSGIANRHHVRFWATTHDDSGPLNVNSIHWHHQHREQLSAHNLLWVGAASLDVGIAPIRHNLQITHMIHPDTNRERDLITKQLQTAGMVQKTEEIKLGRPYQLINRALRGYLQTDGIMRIIYLD